jgi:hypothetical protein
MSFPKSDVWYRLTNDYLGTSKSLDVVNDNGTHSSGKLQMAASGNYTGQFWRFVHSPNADSTTVYIYTQFLGPNKRLDVYGDDKTKPHLADAGNYSGQIWTVTPWGDGSYRLTNNFSGSGLHLDVYSDTNVPFLGDGNHSGQHWRFTQVGKVE